MAALLFSPSRLVALVLVAAVIALVAWALQLMQAANDRQEFSLMLAGCMVCSAAVGLATVMVLTLTGPGPGELSSLPGFSQARLSEAALQSGVESFPDPYALPWDGQF